MAHRPDLAISVSNYSRRYSTTPCANVLLDEVVLNFFKSPALWAGLFTLSHGLLDALTDGGLGIAFFAPFNETRYFFPWRPIMVSPIGLSQFFSSWGLGVLLSELIWIGIPVTFWLLGQRMMRRREG